jgi:hypothetical protein
VKYRYFRGSRKNQPLANQPSKITARPWLQHPGQKQKRC